MTAKQRDAKEVIEAGHGRRAAAAILGIQPQSLKRRLRRAGEFKPMPVGRPKKNRLQRISYAATGLF